MTRLLAALALSTVLAACAARAEPSPPVVEAPSGVCPPFPLMDEAGQVIDPVHGVNAAAPYSPRQTCGAAGCHDYETITEGFHFTQGRGEALPESWEERFAWTLYPGNYGGNWCSPAPLYQALAPKVNAHARDIDMTSFDFITAGCGTCHPGGGPLETDREGHRYDTWMADPASGLASGAQNGLDGDYYRARWAETGVIEADCLLCHQPEYDYKARNAQLAALNFRWAATQGASFGKVVGSVAAGTTPTIEYDPGHFDADGNVIVHIAVEPRNETCLNCHSKPGWKKRGASFTARTDVHLAAGMRCVDCHGAGKDAPDPRIQGHEAHQFGKGDDPSGFVRNDLDDTVRSCESCHLDGWHDAPRARHDWLPPLHLDELACQTCHIPSRAAKSASVQASDVYNPAPRITPLPKRIWTFYDANRDFWNHYGALNLFTAKDQPTDIHRPTLFRYKGKIYPGNRVHSAWVGYEEEGRTGLGQVQMKDFFQLWTKHRAAPDTMYPELAEIRDDDGDGSPEVNRPEEIDALLSATRQHLEATGFPLEGRTLVWVSDDVAWRSSTRSRTIPKEAHEASPYASVYKYSHDVAPAKAALGSGGCIDCHASGAGFFDRPLMVSAFGAGGQPVWASNAEILGASPSRVALGAIREGTVKPAIYALLAITLALAGGLGTRFWTIRAMGWTAARGRLLGLGLVVVVAAGGLIVLTEPGLLSYMTLSRFALDAAHFPVAVLILVIGALSSTMPLAGTVGRWLRWTGLGLLALATACGGLMLLEVDALETLGHLSYTGFDLALALSLVVSAVQNLLRLLRR